MGTIVTSAVMIRSRVSCSTGSTSSGAGPLGYAVAVMAHLASSGSRRHRASGRAAYLDRATRRHEAGAAIGCPHGAAHRAGGPVAADPGAQGALDADPLRPLAARGARPRPPRRRRLRGALAVVGRGRRGLLAGDLGLLRSARLQRARARARPARDAG